MKLAASQIGWTPEAEAGALEILREAGFAGLEIAPTRVAGPAPYDSPDQAAAFAAEVRAAYRMDICSMQSIWYGQSGSLFGPERQTLLDYTKKAVLFAKACGASNLVFGSPKNRVKPPDVSEDIAVAFFKELGDFAADSRTVLALEANPPVYGTNFMNTTAQALEMARRVNSPGCKVNLDFGTILTNGEDIESLAGQVGMFNHVHISEPELAMVQQRPQHRELAALLRAEGYNGYVSIEMKQQPLENLKQTAAWVAEVFG